MIENILCFFDTYFRPIIVIISTLFAIFFYWRKVGNSVVVTYKVSSDRISARRISDIIVTNKKDRPVPIYAIHALFNKEIVLTIKECKPPLILKPYELLSIETDEYSSLYLENQRYDPDLLQAEILIESVDGLIKCKKHKKKGVVSNKYRRVMKNIESFNNIIHMGNFKYILVYKYEGSIKTTFIHESGYLEHDWNFAYNMINFNGKSIDEKIINKFLIDFNYDKLFLGYRIFLYKDHDYILVYDKPLDKISVSE